MSVRMERTRHPGVYKRGSRYVVVWQHNGRQHKSFHRTKAEALEAQGKRRQHGDKRPPTRKRFEEYAREWLETYGGRTGRGRPGALTSKDYLRSIERAIKFFEPRARRLSDVGPSDVRAYVRELEGEGMAASSVRKRLAPLKAMFATAVEDEDLPRDPTRNVRVTGGKKGEGKEKEVRAMTRAELSRFLAEVPDYWRLFFELLAHSGLRISEQLGLDCGDVVFGDRPRVRVERQNCKGETRGLKYESEREIPLSPGMAQRLWVATAGRAKDAPLFANARGGRLSESNLRYRVLEPARARAGLPWVTFHTFRHTCASLQIEAGRNVVQVSKWLGHADVQIAHKTYSHLMEEGVGDAAFMDELVVAPREAEEAAVAFRRHG
jgi:integrase